MKSSKPVIILPGQLYLDEEKNAYLIVTKKHGEVVSYAGPGFRGMLEDDVFLNRFPPVDPEDVSAGELSGLLGLCPAGTTARVGFIKD
jgi:hypothetical protein